MPKMRKKSSMGETHELRVRNMDAVVLKRLDTMARKQGMSRNEYVKGILTNLAYASEVKELDSRYQELFKIVIDTIEGNSQILHQILIALQGERDD